MKNLLNKIIQRNLNKISECSQDQISVLEELGIRRTKLEDLFVWLEKLHPQMRYISFKEVTDDYEGFKIYRAKIHDDQFKVIGDTKLDPSFKDLFKFKLIADKNRSMWLTESHDNLNREIEIKKSRDLAGKVEEQVRRLKF